MTPVLHTVWQSCVTAVAGTQLLVGAALRMNMVKSVCRNVPFFFFFSFPVWHYVALERLIFQRYVSWNNAVHAGKNNDAHILLLFISFIF